MATRLKRVRNLLRELIAITSPPDFEALTNACSVAANASLSPLPTISTRRHRPLPPLKSVIRWIGRPFPTDDISRVLLATVPLTAVTHIINMAVLRVLSTTNSAITRSHLTQGQHMTRTGLLEAQHNLIL